MEFVNRYDDYAQALYAMRYYQAHGFKTNLLIGSPSVRVSKA